MVRTNLIMVRTNFLWFVRLFGWVDFIYFMIEFLVFYLQGTRSGMRRFIVGLASFLAAASSTGVASAAPTLTVLHSFTGYPDGIEPLGRLAMDSSGALYGTTFGGGTTGGGFGTVFKLAPPAAGKTQWTKTILYAFT